MKKANATLRVKRLTDQVDHEDFSQSDPAQRIAAMWQLALDAWAFKGERVAESRLPRHIVRIQRAER